MPLPSTGEISLSAVNVELGLNATAQISMNDALVRTLAGVASGAIGMNNLQGKSAVPPKSSTTWSLITSAPAISTYPVGIRKGDAVFNLFMQGYSAPAPTPAGFLIMPGQDLLSKTSISFFPQGNFFVHLKQSISFIAGTNTMGGSSLPSNITGGGQSRILVFRRSPDYFEDPTLSFLGTEVNTSSYASQAVAYAGDPSVILGLASTSRSNLATNVMTATIGGVTPSVEVLAPNAVDATRLFYRLNITPTTLTTAATFNGTSTVVAGYRPFVVH